MNSSNQVGTTTEPSQPSPALSRRQALRMGGAASLLGAGGSILASSNGASAETISAAEPTIVFSTIAEMRANTTQFVEQTAFVRGYHSATNPRGGGTFILDDTDTTTADDGGWVIVDAIGQRWMRACVKLYADDFGATGLGVAEDGPACRAALAKITETGDGALYFAGGDYHISGDGTEVVGDVLANGLLVPERGVPNFRGDVHCSLIGEGRTRLTATSDNMALVRFSDVFGRIENIDLYNLGSNATTLVNNVGLVIGPEDITQTTVASSNSRFIGKNCAIDGFKDGVIVQPGPTVGGSASGSYYHKFYDFDLNFCVRSWWFRGSVNDVNNYPTRVLINGGRVERTMVAFDIRVAETVHIVNVFTQSVNKVAADFPNYNPANLPVTDGNARIFWISDQTRLCKIIGGHNESNHHRGVWAENGTPLSALSSSDYDWNGVHWAESASTGGMPHARVYSGNLVRLAPTNQLGVSEMIRHRYGGAAGPEWRIDRNANGVAPPANDISLWQNARLRYELAASAGDHIWYDTTSGTQKEVMRLGANGTFTLTDRATGLATWIISAGRTAAQSTGAFTYRTLAGPLSLDGFTLIDFLVNGTRRAQVVDTGVNIGVTASNTLADGSNPGVSICHPDTTTTRFATATTTTKNHIGFYNNALVGTISTNGANTTYATSSDERLKKNLRDFDSGALIDALGVWEFDWTNNPGSGHGVMAQQAEKVLPIAVNKGNDKKPGHPEFEPWGVDYSKFVPILLREMQKLRQRVKELEDKEN